MSSGTVSAKAWVNPQGGVFLQVVHNQHLAEFYLIDKDKKFTIERVNGEWRCSCYEPNCIHIKEVQDYLGRNK